MKILPNTLLKPTNLINFLTLTLIDSDENSNNWLSWSGKDFFVQ